MACEHLAWRNLSYALPPRFPFGDIRLVMESVPWSCNLYANASFCSDVERDLNFEPEAHVKDAISSFLVGCHIRNCTALDLGANNGWFAAYMLSLGARVVAVEPQHDMVIALRRTIELNCWTDRARVLHAFCFSTPPPVATLPVTRGYRAGGYPPALRLPNASVVSFERVLHMSTQLARKHASRPTPFHAAEPPTIDLIKMDADGP